MGVVDDTINDMVVDTTNSGDIKLQNEILNETQKKQPDNTQQLE